MLLNQLHSPWIMSNRMAQVELLHTPQDMESLLFDGPGSAARTLQSYVNTCSWGQAGVDVQNSKVEVVPLACTGEHR